MKFLNYILINKEARLFDTKEFLIKTFVAVLIGYVVGTNVTFISRDMISLLFGMMLTLEPVNMTGVQSALKQIEATIIGAMITGVILALFGYNPWTAALAVTATLYVSLVIDWRSVSVVAIFTSIYMTQYVQLDRFGEPSEFETFKLRMAALLTGVAIAFLVNLIFSLFAYKHMLEKRVYHLLDHLSSKMTDIHSMLKDKRFEDAVVIMSDFHNGFNNTEWIIGTIIDFKKDPFVKRGELKMIKLEKILTMTDLIREMDHINYDMCYRTTKGDNCYLEDDFVEHYERTINRFHVVIEKLDLIIHNKAVGSLILGEKLNVQDMTLKQLNENIDLLDKLLSSY